MKITEKDKKVLRKLLKVKSKDVPLEKREIFNILEKSLKKLARKMLKL